MPGQKQLKLSVLDLVNMWGGATAAEAIAETVALAQQVERLGYTRYWLAEHHNTPWQASSAPELLIGHVAAATSTLRVGSGGVMLPNHTPLKVVENFHTLEALYPGRIDLGLGRAPGTDSVTALALRRTRQATGADDFPEQLAELLAFFTGDFPDDHPFQRITPVPVVDTTPEVWILGSSENGARVAAHYGLGFVFAHHISPAPAMTALRTYRREFRPSVWTPEPRAILAVSVYCTKTEEEAEDITAILTLRWLRMQQGWNAPPPTLEEARTYRYTEAEAAHYPTLRARLTAGTVEPVAERLRQLTAEAEVDELMMQTMGPDAVSRRRSFELVAGALGVQ